MPLSMVSCHMCAYACNAGFIVTTIHPLVKAALVKLSRVPHEEDDSLERSKRCLADWRNLVEQAPEGLFDKVEANGLINVCLLHATRNFSCACPPNSLV
jgi:hypothetical protein